jgi:hypothetical protein
MYFGTEGVYNNIDVDIVSRTTLLPSLPPQSKSRPSDRALAVAYLKYISQYKFSERRSKLFLLPVN